MKCHILRRILPLFPTTLLYHNLPYNLKDGAVHLFVYGKGQLFPKINLGKKALIVGTYYIHLLNAVYIHPSEMLHKSISYLKVMTFWVSQQDSVNYLKRYDLKQ